MNNQVTGVPGGEIRARTVKSMVEKGFEPNSQFALFREIFQLSFNDSPNAYQSALLKESEFRLRQ